MSDARHLVALLETGDEIDPVIGNRLFRTRSSADLPDLAVVVAWPRRPTCFGSCEAGWSR